MIEMEEVPRINDEIGLKMLFSQDRTLYEFHSSVYIQRSLYTTIVNFKSKHFTHIKTKGILGKMTSSYKLEYLDNKESSFAIKKPENNSKRNSSSNDILMEESDKLQASIKCTWKSTFCENSKKLFINDCFQENDMLKQTLERFIYIAESRAPTEIEKTPANTILEACERKKLRRKCTLKKQDTQDLEFNY